MNEGNVTKKMKNNECNRCNSKRQNKIAQEVCMHAFPSNSSANSRSTLIIASVLWTIIIVLFQFIHDLLIVMMNYFWNTDNTGAKMKETKGNEIVRKKHETITYYKQRPNTSKMVNNFANVDRYFGMDDVSTYGSDFSPVDSGIGSRPISRANTNETLSECIEESGIIHESFRHRTRKWYNKSDYDQITRRSDSCRASRELTRIRQGSFAPSDLPLNQSLRQELSITRHVTRVRDAHSKRAKSAVAAVRIRKSKSEME
ncbi:hypothetical protein QQG55_21370 [Brugia pahangi]